MAGLDVHAVRRMWPNLLDEIRRKKKVTWMLAERVNVLGMDSGRLTLGFTEAGALKVFGGSGHQEVVRQAIIDLLGVDLTVEGVLDPGARPTAAAAASSTSSPSSARRGATARSSGSAGRPAASAPSAAPSAVPSAAPDSAPGEAPPPPPDDAPQADDVDDDPGLSGAALIAEQLGGRVIGEIGAD